LIRMMHQYPPDRPTRAAHLDFPILTLGAFPP
jgi:hypothetical protein